MKPVDEGINIGVMKRIHDMKFLLLQTTPGSSGHAKIFRLRIFLCSIHSEEMGGYAPTHVESHAYNGSYLRYLPRPGAKRLVFVDKEKRKATR